VRPGNGNIKRFSFYYIYGRAFVLAAAGSGFGVVWLAENAPEKGVDTGR